MTSEATIAPPRSKLPNSGYRDYYWLRSFVAGGVASCCAKSTIAPLDRIKILFQAQNIHYRHLGVLATIKAVKQKEGFLGFYKGNGAMMVRIFPYGAIQFMAFDRYKKFVRKNISKSEHLSRLMAGSMAGITAVMCTYPLDMVRARLAFQVTGEHKYNGIIDAFKSIYTKEGGFRGYYRGLVPTVIGMAPYAGFSFFTFETLKTAGLKHAPELLGKPSFDNPDVMVLKTPVSLCCGGIAGAISQTISYPLDVTRRRMQLSAILPDSEKCRCLSREACPLPASADWGPCSLCGESGRMPSEVTGLRTMFQTLKYVCTAHGIRKGLYRGLSLNYIRCIPSQAVAFTTYEFMRQILHLNESPPPK